MQSPLKRYLALGRRWLWLVALAVVLCGGAGYVVTKLMKPVYQASAFVVVNLSTTTVPYDVNGSLAITPTYAQLMVSPAVLDQVVAQHPGLTLTQLSSMISVKPQSNTQTIELDVQNDDPVLAAQLANEISKSLNDFANSRLSGGVQVLPADVPTTPIGPKGSLNAAIGALVGLALAVAIIVLFEWFDDYLRDPEELQDLLGLDTLSVIPRLSRRQMSMSVEEIPAPAEGCRILCANLNAAQSSQPFKLVMVASALPAEGRTTVATNMAVFLAMSGKQVLLVDADLRRPGLHEHFRLDKRYGLASILLNLWEEDDTELDGQTTSFENLRVLPAGVLSSNPGELLQLPEARRIFEHFEESQFDYVIFDTPPLLPVADAQVLASYVHTLVLVVDASKTPRKALVRAGKALSRAHANVLGAVINKSRWAEDSTISAYLKSVALRQSKVGVSRKKAPMSAPPNTPPVNGMVNHDAAHELVDAATITLARPQKDKKEDGEK
ncbi:MAG TPA: polysaccharide biosynthesis tyrosine autokinase [Ktedonobacteraceae bacterium]|nr:polysaccharide biosynthesis tyrosine autokinase [Ktedonobacteraceae bacterium]